MNRIYLIIALAMLLSIGGVAIASDATEIVLTEKACDVDTSKGSITLPVGTKLGGTPENYITLEETREFQTADGPKIVDSGERIYDYELEPGTPDPCGG